MFCPSWFLNTKRDQRNKTIVHICNNFFGRVILISQVFVSFPRMWRSHSPFNYSDDKTRKGMETDKQEAVVCSGPCLVIPDP
jgi:hypothetical protein